MAWIERKSISIIESPHVHWTEETIETILRANAEVVDRFSGLSPDHPDYIKKGDAPAGLPIALPRMPFQAYIKELHGPLPDALTTSIVNNRIKAAVEAFEPAVHQFIPTIVTMPDGTRHENWWAMRACHRVDAVAIEHCEDLHEYRPRPFQFPNWYYYRSNEGSRMKVLVRKARISGKALWYDWRFRRPFFGEELGQRFLDEGIRGYRLRPEDDLMRSNHVAEV